jgi:hypothetical protein
VWRDSKVTNPQPFSCNAAGPPQFPLGEERAFTFNVSQQPTEVAANADPFPLRSQRVVTGTAGFPLPAKPGGVYLGLSHASANPPSDPLAAQAFVTVLEYPDRGQSATGSGAVALDSADDARHPHPN